MGSCNAMEKQVRHFPFWKKKLHNLKNYQKTLGKRYQCIVDLSNFEEIRIMPNELYISD